MLPLQQRHRIKDSHANARVPHRGNLKTIDCTLPKLSCTAVTTATTGQADALHCAPAHCQKGSNYLKMRLQY
jgi:hypothetical protein